MHHNIRGLNNKLEELKIIIKKHNPDIITINESHTIKINTYIQNYTITQPLNNTGKKIAIIHRNNLTVDIDPITINNDPNNLNHSIDIITKDNNNYNMHTLLPKR